MSGSDRDVVIVSAVRTPIGKFGGSLKELRAYQLAGVAMEAAIARAGVEKGAIDEVIAGDCIQCPDEANTARTAALSIGIPVEVPAYTVQKQCSSSMQALSSARTQILAGEAEIVLVVGVESMSNAPYVLKTARWGQRLTHGEMTDTIWELLYSGSGLLGERMIMGETAENLARKYGISRREQDEVALRSNNNAERAVKSGAFREEIAPVSVKTRKGETVVDTDEHLRLGLTLADLEDLKPVFRKDGTVTAGNSSGINDGAAAVVVTSRGKALELGLKPLGRVVAQTSAGVAPEIMGYGPVPPPRSCWPARGSPSARSVLSNSTRRLPPSTWRARRGSASTANASTSTGAASASGIRWGAPGSGWSSPCSTRCAGAASGTGLRPSAWAGGWA